MTVLRESPWYLELQQEGEQRGRVEQAQSLILRLLTHKFDTLSSNIEVQVKSLDLTLVVQKTLKRLEGLEDSHFSEFNVGIESVFLLERSTSRGRIVSG
jgi:predicted transposase YdaD